MRAEYKPIFMATLLSFLPVVSVAEATISLEDNSTGGDSIIQASTDEINEATRYMSDMGDFAFGCTNAMYDSDLRNRAIAECMEVVRDFNSNMSQLWNEHGNTIDYYRAKSTGDSSGGGGSLDIPSLQGFLN
jgi:hypothetical protein